MAASRQDAAGGLDLAGRIAGIYSLIACSFCLIVVSYSYLYLVRRLRSFLGRIGDVPRSISGASKTFSARSKCSFGRTCDFSQAVVIEIILES